MLGCSADKALICGLMWSVSWCLSLCLESMATGSCSQHIVGLGVRFVFTAVYHIACSVKIVLKS